MEKSKKLVVIKIITWLIPLLLGIIASMWGINNFVATPSKQGKIYTEFTELTLLFTILYPIVTVFLALIAVILWFSYSKKAEKKYRGLLAINIIYILLSIGSTWVFWLIVSDLIN